MIDDANFLAEKELVDSLRNGDEVAYAKIYQLYSHALIRFAEHKLYDLDEACDVVHDVFTSLWKNKETLTVTNSLKAYLFSATKHQAINKIRKNLVREDYSEKLKKLSPAFYSLEEELYARELQTRVNDKLSELPAKTQYIYAQRKDNHKSIKDIAEELNLSDQTVKNQISIALKHLRKSLSMLLLSIF